MDLHIHIKASLSSVAGNERQFVFVRLDTWIRSELNSWRCEVDGNLFCMSAADSCRGPLARSATDASFIGQTRQGRRESQPAGKPGGGLNAGPGVRSAARSSLQPCVISLSPKLHRQETTAAG